METEASTISLPASVFLSYVVEGSEGTQGTLASRPVNDEGAGATNETGSSDAANSSEKKECPCKGSDISSAEEGANIVHAQRLGIDIPVDPNDEELSFQASRIFKIENLKELKRLRVKTDRR